MGDLREVLPHTGSLIRRAQQRHVAEWNRLVSKTITSVQFAALAVLAHQPEASQRELGDALEMDRSTIADLAARLERHGLVERAQDPADKRRYILRLTALGKNELERLRPLADEVEQALPRSLQASELKLLHTLLYALLKG